MNAHLKLLTMAREQVESADKRYICDALTIAYTQCPWFPGWDQFKYKIALDDLLGRVKELIEGRYSLDVLWIIKNPNKIEYGFGSKEYWDFFRPMRLALIDQLKEEFK